MSPGPVAGLRETPVVTEACGVPICLFQGSSQLLHGCLLCLLQWDSPDTYRAEYVSEALWEGGQGKSEQEAPGGGQ